MKFLVIDTETTGLFNFKLPADAEGQPRLAHLAMIWADAEGKELDRQDLYVRPNGWSMPQGPGSAGAVNGLTDEFLQANGADINDVLDQYLEEVRRGLVVVAFNAQYDLKVMRGELRRAGKPDLFEQTLNVCVMRPMTALCKITYANRGGFKFPNLGEALAYFGHELKDAHKAMNDAEGALIVMRELLKLGELPTPAVHYAKEKPAEKLPKTRSRKKTPDFTGSF
ncbi:3'-5' exonuclease [Brucella pseudogrignonensis]|uniref:DNA polymerase III epsilon subunit-like protein n=1 Tax=Brucella pseudogrignonensis TaxID=419475 RepID=A0ABU1M5Y0_9HYPH|nr:3'-5' exonuclease [Brucella pseudogrignonensis]MDR6431255.1 DNA polymerase III epsilon subunit-like protein [Brucella pseudogrignonensis]